MSRALVEFLVIVSSILVAFGLDAWWEARGENEQERAQLESLHSEFAATRAELQGLRVRLESLRTAVVGILPLIGPSVEIVPIDSLTNLIDLSFRLGTIELKTGAVQAVLTSGELAAMNEPTLKAIVAGWPAEVADLRTQTRLMEENRELIIDYLHDRLPTLDVAHNTGMMGRYARSSFSVTGARFQRDMRVEGLFGNRGMMIEDTDEIVIDLIAQASQAMALLQAELSG